MDDTAKITEFSPGMGLDEVQAEYQGKLYEYMADYMQSGGSVVIDRNKYNRAINDGFTFAFIAGWTDAGASALNAEAQSWLNGRISQEIAFVAPLFTQLKALRADDTIPLEDKLTACQAHAEAYTMTLNGVYAQGLLMAKPEIDLTFDGDDGSSDSICQSNNGTCVQLKGQTHPASWWVKKGLIPGPGNPNYDCGGWNCRHKLVDKDGNIWADASGAW